MALQHGDVVELTLFDRTVWDHIIEDDTPQNVVLRAADVFKFSRAKYVHDHGVVGTITYHFLGIKATPEPMPFTWDIEFECSRWYPFGADGLLHGDAACKVKGAPRHWSTFPPTTRVGWRGPCVRTALLAFMPNMFHVSSERESAGAERHKAVARGTTNA